MDARPVGASLRRRALAGAIDVLVVLVAAFGFLGFWLWWAPRHDWRSPDPSPELLRRIKRWSRPLQATSVLVRNVRSPGQSILGLRRVDARTGAAQSLQIAVRRLVVEVAISRAVMWLTRPLLAPVLEHREALSRRVEAHRAEHGWVDWSDPSISAAGGQMRLGCLRSLAPGVVSSLIRTLSPRLDPRHRTYVDRLSGVVVTRER